jgi:BirA family biotin operon repressor/biotin-[acetyl-CoA-carboxylase] ligase
MTMLHWDAETLWQDLEPLAPGLSVEVRAEVDSTNTRLLERPRQGDTLPCLLVAEHQTAGRGRLGRTWWSQPGQSLTFSLGLKLAPADWSGLSLAVGLALAEALGGHIGLKWPNDLWLRGDDRKLGGILIEVAPLPGAAERPGERWVVIGAGLNVTPVPSTEVEAGTFRTGHACLQEFEPELTAPQVLHRIARPLLQAVLAFESAGLDPLRSRLAARDVLARRTVQAGAVTGTAIGLSEDGSLQVRDAHGTVHSLHSGEVSVRPC